MLKITQKVKLNKSALKKIIFPVVFILLLLFFNIITSGRYLMINNLTSVISRSIIPALLAWGISFLFITGIIDLSIGAIFLLASNVAGILGLQIVYPGLILGGLITSVLLTYINTFLFLKMLMKKSVCCKYRDHTGKVVISTGLSSISQLFVPLAIFLLAIILRKFVNLAFGIVASSFFVNSLFNVMLILGVPRGTWQEMILGIVIIIFGILSQINRGDVVK